MSKSLTLFDPKVRGVAGTKLDPLAAAQLHQCVLTAGAISAASAVMCGLELQAIKKTVKAQKGTFLAWFEQHEKQLGFSVRTKDKYMAAAEETKAKLLKQGDKNTLRLLTTAPGSMSPEDRAKLLKAVSKCIGAQTLMDIYLEAGIVRNIHKAPMRIGGGDAVSEGEPVDAVQEAVNEILEAIGNRSNQLNQTIKVGGKDILAISRCPAPKLQTAIELLKHDLQLLVKVKGAMK